MTWDLTSPADNDQFSLGDDVIRELKTDLQNALRFQEADGDFAKFPGSDPANPVFRYRGEKAGSAPSVTDGGLFFNTTRNAFQRSTGAAWEDVGTNIPAGTKMVFFQAAAPTGWTKDAGNNDKLLRIVDGAGGSSGGTSTVTGLAHTHTIAHTHTVASSGAHRHTIAATGGEEPFTEYVYSSSDIRTNSAGAHTHTGATSETTPTSDSVTISFCYIDVIVCEKI